MLELFKVSILKEELVQFRSIGGKFCLYIKIKKDGNVYNVMFKDDDNLNNCKSFVDENINKLFRTGVLFLGKKGSPDIISNDIFSEMEYGILFKEIDRIREKIGKVGNLLESLEVDGIKASYKNDFKNWVCSFEIIEYTVMVPINVKSARSVKN